MSTDSKILRRAIEALEKRRSAREAELDRRREELYRRIPRLLEIDRELRMTVLGVLETAFRMEEAEDLDGLRRKNLELQAEYAELLHEAGRPVDYLDDAPYCKKCSDRGFKGSEMCACLRELYRAEQKKELSETLRLGGESFDSFDLGYYGDEKGESGMSPRENMELVYETCLNYARKFDARQGNLLLTGGPGLGKTFLSACIARVVSENGYSVVYDTAVGILAAFEEEKFSRNSDENDELRGRTRRYINCDLLIVDDLGSEMLTSFVVSALYTLVNSRLTSGRQTIISTNLAVEELRRRYSAQTVSRIEGCYRILPFRGKDIRLIKKNRGI